MKTDFTASRRTVEPVAGRSEYVAASTKAIGKMAEDEAKGCRRPTSPRQWRKVLAAKRPPRRISAGSRRRAGGALGQATPALCALREDGEGQSRRVVDRGKPVAFAKSYLRDDLPSEVGADADPVPFRVGEHGERGRVVVGDDLSAGGHGAIDFCSAVSGATQTSRWNR